MRKITSNELINYVKDFDYEISTEQAIEIMKLLDEYSLDGTFNSIDIQQTTDYIVNGSNSIYADYF